MVYHRTAWEPPPITEKDVELIQYVSAHQGCTTKQLVEVTGLSVSQLYVTLAKLENRQLIVSTKDANVGNKKLYYTRNGAADLMNKAW